MRYRRTIRKLNNRIMHQWRKVIFEKLGIENVNQYPFFMSSARVDNFEGGQNENYKIKRLIQELQNEEAYESYYKSLVKKQIRIKQIDKLLGDKNYQSTSKIIYPNKRVIFIGNTSAGKSKLINKLFGLQLKTGKGQTTLKCERVHETDHKIDIFDSIGYNDQFIKDKTKCIEQLNQINNSNLGSLKSLSNLIEIICKPGQRMYKVAFIYTKCDTVDPQEDKIPCLIEKVRQQLKSFGIENADEYPFFTSSAKVDNFEGGQNDNHKIINMINQLA